MMSQAYPVVDLALIPGHDRGDMVLNDLSKLVSVAHIINPSGELGVPDEGMPTDGLVARGRPVDQVIGLAPVVLALAWLQRLPLHAVLRRYLPKVGLDDRRVLALLQPALVGAHAEVLLALRLEQPVHALGCLPGFEGGGGRCQRRQQEKEVELHGHRLVWWFCGIELTDADRIWDTGRQQAA